MNSQDSELLEQAFVNGQSLVILSDSLTQVDLKNLQMKPIYWLGSIFNVL